MRKQKTPSPAATSLQSNGAHFAKLARARKPQLLAAPAQPAATQIAARIDVGFGNTLFIRGQGEGLSWAKGQPLTCVEADRWVWSTPQPNSKVAFKLLLNDQIWAQGEDVILEPGKTLEFAPRF